MLDSSFLLSQNIFFSLPPCIGHWQQLMKWGHDCQKRDHGSLRLSLCPCPCLMPDPYARHVLCCLLCSRFLFSFIFPTPSHMISKMVWISFFFFIAFLLFLAPACSLDCEVRSPAVDYQSVDSQRAAKASSTNMKLCPNETLWLWTVENKPPYQFWTSLGSQSCLWTTWAANTDMLRWFHLLAAAAKPAAPSNMGQIIRKIQKIMWDLL